MRTNRRTVRPLVTRLRWRKRIEMSEPKDDRQRAIDEAGKAFHPYGNGGIGMAARYGYDAGYQAAQNCPNCGKIEDRPNEDCNPRTTLTD